MSATHQPRPTEICVDAGAQDLAPRLFLQPIAAPSILGLFGFAIATFIVAANVAMRAIELEWAEPGIKQGQ